MENFKENIITIRYITKEKGKIRIFGDNFVKNNKNNCKIIYINKERELEQFIKFKNFINIGVQEIQLKVYNDLTDMSYMFSDCDCLLSLPDISKLNTKNVIDMNHMFYFCESLESLDISKWDTKNVTNMSYMFSYCKSLKTFPNISNWNTSNVKDISNMFLH